MAPTPISRVSTLVGIVMSALQPFRQRLAAISQSSTAIVELTNRFEVRSLQHRLWSFDHLIETSHRMDLIVP